jgi:hypothetical protein
MTRRPEEVVAPFSIDLSTGEVHWSPPIYRLYGLCPDADQPAMETLLAAIIPEDRDRAREEFTAGIRDGGTFSIRYHLHGADGRRHEIHLTAVGSRLNGVTRYISGFLIDVTAPMTARLNAAVAASAANRATIEQAKGAIMLGYTVTDREAFTVLRHYSNQHNVRLSVVADRIVHALNSEACGDPSARQAVIALFADLAAAVKRDRAATAAAVTATHQVAVPVQAERSTHQTPG